MLKLEDIKNKKSKLKNKQDQKLVLSDALVLHSGHFCYIVDIVYIVDIIDIVDIVDFVDNVDIVDVVNSAHTIY